MTSKLEPRWPARNRAPATSWRLPHELATADAVVCATVLAFGAALLIYDANLEALPFGSYAPKRAAQPITKN